MQKPIGNDGLIIALDVETSVAARAVVRRLGPSADFYKVPPGLALQDSSLIPWLKRSGRKVFLDGKWYDIPSQVRRSVESAGRLGVDACSVHISAGREVLKAALSAHPRPKIWGITVLTSLSDQELRQVGISSGTKAQVARLARLANEVRLDGIVCSPREAAFLRKLYPRLTIVTPGIQIGAKRGEDQKRLATPELAWRAGADYLVVGRAVLESSSPAGMVQKILAVKPC